jgi:hypothetical protein
MTFRKTYAYTIWKAGFAICDEDVESQSLAGQFRGPKTAAQGHTNTRAPRFEFSRGDQQERENLIF